MFKKPLSNLKSFNLLSSSDRRRLRDEIYAAFPPLKEVSEREGAEPLLPSSIEIAKFATHINEHGAVYVVDKDPVWIKVDKMIFPSVYTLWKHPEILPIIYTWAPVIDRLSGGADLMIPGIIVPPEGLPDLKVGTMVAIAIKGYSFPLAVGTLATPSLSIKSHQGMRGKAVYTLHVYKDRLWDMGTKSEPPNLSELVGKDEEMDEEMAEEEGGEMGGERILGTVGEEATRAHEAGERAQASDYREVEAEDPSKSLSVDEIDAILRTSLYSALKFNITAQHPASLFPLSSSTLYSSYILPSRPSKYGNEIDVKKSSYKKVAKFMKAMEKAGVVKLKEQKGEIYLIGVNWGHDELEYLEPYHAIKTSTSTSASASPSGAASHSAAANSPSDRIEIVNLYKPHGPTVRLFEEVQRSKDDLYTSRDVKTIVMAYVKEQGLVNPRNQNQVKIDAVLCDAVLKREEAISVEYLTRDRLVTKFLENMQEWYQMTLPGKEATVGKGKVKPIQVTVQSVRGRKTTTTIAGVENFGLSVDELAERLKKLCASSVAISPLQGAPPQKQLKEIMVQGPQVKFVGELLLSKGVPERYMEVKDKTKGK